MGLAEDLKALQDLRDKGEMSQSTYAIARDVAINKHAAPSGSFRLGHFIGKRLLPLAIIVMLVWGAGRVFYGRRQADGAVSSFIHSPIKLTDEVQNLPAASWKAVNYNLPVGGTLDVNLQVIRGNPIDVMLTTVDQLEIMNKGQWANLRVFSEFSATKTMTYKRTGLLGPGNYYLVLRDTSLGILSASATDVSLKVQLNP